MSSPGSFDDQTPFQFDPMLGIAPDDAASTAHPKSDEILFRNAKGIEPRTGPPYKLAAFIRKSDILRGHIDTLRATVASGGWEPEFKVNLDDDDDAAALRMAINTAHMFDDMSFITKQEVAPTVQAQGRSLTEDELSDLSLSFEVSDENFEDYTRGLKRLQAKDAFTIQSFFNHPGASGDFSHIKDRLVADKSEFGYAYVEIALDPDTGEPKFAKHLPAVTTKVCPEPPEQLETKQLHQLSPVVWSEVNVSKRYVVFIQREGVNDESNAVYYKELGDPRFVSSKDGRAYTTLQQLNIDQPGVRPANAILFFTEYDGESPYAYPVWWAARTPIEGAIRAEESAKSFFDRPPGLLAFQNTTITQEEVAQVGRAWNTKKGKKKFNDITTIKLDGIQTAGTTGFGIAKPSVEFVRLAYQNENDPHFEKYTDRVDDRVSSLFRFARVLRGQVGQLNRATAKIAVQLAERLVFAPYRRQIDSLFNRDLLPLLGVRHAQIKSNPPVMTDYDDILGLIEASHKGTLLTPNEQRELVSPLVGAKYPKVTAEWGSIPGRILLSGNHSNEKGEIEPIAETPVQAPSNGNDGENVE